VSSADVGDACPGASENRFSPNELPPGNYAFDIGTAGSTTLIAQALIPVLVLARAPFQITLDGGTHKPMSSPFEFFQRAYLPLPANVRESRNCSAWTNRLAWTLCYPILIQWRDGYDGIRTTN
jgi:RNA 3'-terminal phosphate cyclase